jgi:1-acyl-sn-glycerol-3-phosphate acyltransferase
LNAALRTFLEALFRVFFTYVCRGQDHVPAIGGAVIAANHPSYLDPMLLSLRVARPIRFMAWEGLFRVPMLGPVMRAFGAFPVDTRKGKGREAYAKAKALVESGEVVGIFPEGKRSRTGWMEPSLREGAARLSWETGAPLVPATIAGAFRAWPHYQSLPQPSRIKVRFHEPIDPSGYRKLPEDEALPALLAELRRRVERSLLPGVKADLRRNVLWRQPAPWPRPYESMLALGAALAVFWKTRSLLEVAPAYAYLAYLLLDRFAIPQGRLAKWLRNGSPIFFVLAYAPAVLRVFGLATPLAAPALVAVLLGAAFPYLYEHGRSSLAFVQGMTLAAVFELGALFVAPSALGPHVALPLFAAAFAWERATVFWRYTAPLLVAYAALVPLALGGGAELLPHATAALLSWAAAKLLAASASRAPAGEQTPQGLGL